jgi:hypothetical protein
MQTNLPNSFEDKVLSSLERIDEDLASIKSELSAVKQEQNLFNVRIDTYQKASGQVVNLAFGLISTAVFAILVNVVINRG